MLTEAEAKTKWCPFSRPVMPRTEDCGYQAGNRDYDHSADAPAGSVAIVPPLTNCIGSKCMAWRWVDHIYSNGTVPPPPTGYCGLAGQP